MTANDNVLLAADPTARALLLGLLDDCDGLGVAAARLTERVLNALRSAEADEVCGAGPQVLGGRRGRRGRDRRGAVLRRDLRVPAHGPGIGPKTAAALVACVDISLFRNHDELASYCGVAPANRQSGTSPNSTSPGWGGNRALKNLLVFSCNSLVGTKNRFGAHYEGCRARGMRRNRALKAVARKRLKVICSIMRDPRPCEERHVA